MPFDVRWAKSEENRMVKIEKLTIPAANLGSENPMPDIGNVSYIHADYEMTPKISENEKTHIGARE